jgi:hypothetical protein
LTEVDNRDQQNPKLLITAPKLTSHVFIGGMRNNLALLTNQSIDWSTGYGLKGGNVTFPTNDKIPNEVKKTIFQFSRTDTLVGNIDQDPKKRLGSITLPWPLEFESLRCDSFPSFDDGTKKVGSDIKKHCSGGNGKIGSVSCLKYTCDFSGPSLPPARPIVNYHFYLASCDGDPEDLTHVNAALMEVGNIFPSGNFYLQITSGPFYTQPGSDCDQVAGITGYDELALEEDAFVQMSQWCQGTNQLISQSKTKAIGTNLKKTEHGKKVIPFNISPANCPSFFVGP